MPGFAIRSLLCLCLGVLFLSLQAGLQPLTSWKSRTAFIGETADTNIFVGEARGAEEGGGVLRPSPSPASSPHIPSSAKTNILGYKCHMVRCNSADYASYVRRLMQHVVTKKLTFQSEGFLGPLQHDLQTIVDTNIKGDVYETGIKFGGTSMFMVGVMEAYERSRGVTQPSRQYFFFDSFEGFRPPPKGSLDSKYTNYLLHFNTNGSNRPGAQGVDDLTFVRSEFEALGLLLPRVHFVKGFFEETVPPHANAFAHQIAVLRADGDLYSSTNVVMQCLYPALVSGGIMILDDYLWKAPGTKNLYPCKAAVVHYRTRHGILHSEEPIFTRRERTGNIGKWIKKRNVSKSSGECMSGASYDLDIGGTDSRKSKESK